MNLGTKIFRRVRMLISQVVTPKGTRRIQHLNPQGFDMLALTNEDVGRQIWLFGSFEPDETRYFKEFIEPDDICLDVGGNVGYFSMLFARCAYKGHVHTFEPIPLNAALITVNKEINMFNNITINNVAVGNEHGNVNFSISTDSAYSSIRATGRFLEERSISVPLITLDSYIADKKIERVDVIKIDVEGAEDLVLIGAANLLKDTLRRPRIVLLELFDENLKPFGTGVKMIVDRMIEFGYRPFVLQSGGRTLSDYSPEMANKFYNIIFAPAQPH
jgi:FkbM family methyltransferase